MASPAANDASAFIWLAGFAVAVVAHLWFHPQRPVFIEALRFLPGHPLLMFGIALCHFAAFQYASSTEMPDAITMVWPDFLLVCVKNGATQFAWLPLDLARWHEFPTGMPGQPWVHDLWQGCAAALTQTALCLLCLTRSPKLLASRWLNIIFLALVLTLLNAGSRLMSGELQKGIVLEALLVAAPLPFCIACVRAKFVSTGRFMLLLWRHIWISWVAFAITAVMMLALLNHATRMLALHPGVLSGIVSSIFSAIMHLWLFTVGVLLMRNAGYVVRPSFQL